MIEVTLNGKEHRVETGVTVAQLVDSLVGDTRGVAVAVNSEVLTKDTWAVRTLAPRDRIEILRAVQGGC